MPGAVPANEVRPTAARLVTDPGSALTPTVNGSTVDVSVNSVYEAVARSEQAGVNAKSVAGLRYRIVSSGEVHIEREPSLLSAALALNRRLGHGAWRNLGWEDAQ